MADKYLSAYYDGNNGNKIYLELHVYTVATSIANNTTTERADLYAVVNDASYQWNNNYGTEAFIGINGNNTTRTVTFDYRTTGVKALISTWDTVVQHDNNGAASIGISAHHYSGVGLGNASVSGTYICDTIPRYATSNQSLNSKTETTITMNWSSDSTIDYIWYSKDNGSNWIGIDVEDGKSGTYTISGLSANTSYNIKTRVRRKDSQLTTDSSALSVTTYQYPTVTEVGINELIIGNSQTLTLYNPLGRSVSVYMYQNDTGIQLYSGTTTGTSITFTPNASTMYSSIPSSQTGNCYYYCVYNGQITNYKYGSYKIDREKCLPTVSYFGYKDINEKTIALTGNNQIIVNFFSNVEITIPVANKAIAKNGATIKKYVAVIGSKSIEINYSDTEDVSGVINNVSYVGGAIYAVDSRGLGSEIFQRTFYFKEYKNPTIIDSNVYRENGVGTKVLFELSGKYWNESFGAISNTIDKICFTYKKTTDTSYPDWIDITNYFTIENGIYKNNLNAFLPTNNNGSTAVEFELGIEYNIVFWIQDKTVSFPNIIMSNFLMLNNGIPCMAKQKNSDGTYSIGVNCLPDSNYALKVDGYVKLKRKKAELSIYENTITEVKTNSQYATLISASLTTYGGDLLISAHSHFYNTTAAFWLRGYIEIDGINCGYIFDTNSSNLYYKGCNLVVKNIPEGTHTISIKIVNMNGEYEYCLKPSFTSCGLTVVEL